MATDGPDPKPCDRRIYEAGTCVLISNTIPSNAMEGWVRKVADLSGQPVDWHFVAGRAVVKAMGDLRKVREALETLKPEHDALYKKAFKSLLGHAPSPSQIPWGAPNL